MNILRKIRSHITVLKNGALSDYFRKTSNRVSLLQLLPSMLVITLFLFGGVAIVVVYSFSQDPLSGSFTFTLDNYVEFFNTRVYTDIFIRSLTTALFTTIAGLLISYPMAYYIGMISDSKYKTIMLLLVIIPFWTNVVLRVYAWRLILVDGGLLSYIGGDILGVLGPDFGLLNTRLAVIIGLSHVFLPYMVLPLYSSLTEIDKSEIESAKDLGANRIQAFLEVTLPQSLPGVLAGSTLVFVLSFGSFVAPRLLGGQDNYMIANIIADLFKRLQIWDLGGAIAVVFVAATLSIIYVVNRFVGLENLYGGGS